MLLPVIFFSFFISALCEPINFAMLDKNSNDHNYNATLIGNLIRFNGDLVDRIFNQFYRMIGGGFDFARRGAETMGNSFNRLISRTNEFVGNGVKAGREFGETIFRNIMNVPRSLLELGNVLRDNTGVVSGQVAQSLSYVEGNPKYLFQYITKEGGIIPITEEVAVMLVPKLKL